MTMKVAIVNSAFHPRIVGGIESYLSYVVPMLAQHVSIVVITGPLSVESRKERDCFFRHLTVRELDLGNRYPIWDWRNHSAPVRTIWQILDARDKSVERQMRTCLKEEDPDIVHTHNLRGLSIGALRLPGELGRMHVHSIHDFLLLSPSSNLQLGRITISPNNLVNRLYQETTRSHVSRVNDVVAPSNFILKEHLRRRFFGAARKHVLRMPVISAAEQARLRVGSQRGHPSPAGRTQFLFVGVLERSKGVQVLLAAIRRSPNLAASFHFVGAGRLAPQLSKSASIDPRIQFHGRLPVIDLTTLYNECDVLVFPSVWPENAPMVISEAVTFHLPVLASNIGGVAEIVSDDIGWLVRPGSAHDLAAMLDHIAKNPNEIAARSEAMKRESPLPSLSSHVSELVNVYKHCLESIGF